MKKSKRKISKRGIISFIMMILCTVGAAYFLYAISLLNGIENTIRLILSVIIIMFEVCFIIGFISSLRRKNNSYIMYSILGFIYALLLILFSYYVVKTYKVVDNFTTDATVYSSSLVALKDNKTVNIKDVTGKVGVVNDSNNIIGYIIPKDVIDEEELNVEVKKYTSYIEVINALYEKEIDYAFLPTNYAIMFSSYEGKDFSNIEGETKIVYTKEKSVKNETSSNDSSLTKPFTILLMGVDSKGENIAGSTFNGDSLMLITFNPNTLNATMLSIPRDSYVPIACFAGNMRNKITHAAWGGESCMISTIENLVDVKIDYYVKINFKGLVKIVDALGGVEVDVPYSFCEQNSNREFGNGTIYVNKGYQTLNGEQALAFSRNRHPWPQYCSKEYTDYVSNDFIRGQNQQTVLKAILNKIKEKGDIQTIYNLLEVVSNSMETNMATGEILSLYNIGKDVITKSSTASNIADIIGIQRLYFSGKDAYIYDKSMKLNLYNYVLFNESVDEVKNAMRVNLEIQDATLIKEFSFDINEDYQEKVIGKMTTGTTVSYDPPRYDIEEETPVEEEPKEDEEDKEVEETVKVPNFVGLTYKKALEKAKELGLYLNVPKDTVDDSIVKGQDTASDKEVKVGVTIKLTFEKEEPKEDVEDSNEDTKEPTDVDKPSIDEDTTTNKDEKDDDIKSDNNEDVSNDDQKTEEDTIE